MEKKVPAELSDNLIMDIISRGSEKDLIRFTYVSKSWCSLINTDSYLSQLRYHRTALLNRPFLIVEKRQNVSGGWLFDSYLIELDSIEDGNPKPRQLHNPFDDRQDARVMALCEGLVILQQRSSRKMVVLNPTTNKHHVVPPNPTGGGGNHNGFFMGFGYDRVHDCYKLITQIRHDKRVFELMIYNVNDYTWKKSRFDGLDDEYCYWEPGGCVDGALYWTIYYDDMETNILCFLLAEEEFHKVDPLPDFDEVDPPDFDVVSVTVFDGRLCLVRELPHDKRMELWLMDCDDKRQIGSSYSWRWIKFLSVRETMLPPGCSYSVKFPICFSASRDRILFNVDDRRLFWCDIGENNFCELRTPMN